MIVILNFIDWRDMLGCICIGVDVLVAASWLKIDKSCATFFRNGDYFCNGGFQIATNGDFEFVRSNNGDFWIIVLFHIIDLATVQQE